MAHETSISQQISIIEKLSKLHPYCPETQDLCLMGLDALTVTIPENQEDEFRKLGFLYSRGVDYVDAVHLHFAVRIAQ